MNSFLVLGQIPGTNIQISFEMWLALAGVLALWTLSYMLGFRIRRVNKAMRDLHEVASRTPLHASQLHR